MTRKDYELIAETINGLFPDTLGRNERLQVAQKFADRLAEENDRFNRARFISAACTDVEPVR